MKGWRNVGKWTVKMGLILFLTLILLEVVYRFQWVDFYKNEWKFHNEKVMSNGKSKVLVFGDSFSAEPNSWVNQWRKDSSYAVYNASISGIGPETHRLIFSRRLKEVKPDVVIVQLYVGNDLYDIRKPVNWSKFSFSRNLFWTYSNYFRVLNFINYRFGQFSVEDKGIKNPKIQTKFDVKEYAKRTKLYISGNPNYPSNQYHLDREMVAEFRKLTEMLLEMKASCSEKVKFYVLLVPHCTAVSPIYVTRYEKLGALFGTKQLKNSGWKIRWNSSQLTIIDPLKSLQKKESQGEEMFFQNDPHLNPKGQMVLLETVQNALKP